MTQQRFLPDPKLQQEVVTPREGASFGLGMGLGLLVGLCAGILIAPKAGKEMISELEDKVTELKTRAMDTRDLAAEKWDAAKDRILEAVSSGRMRAAELLGQAHHEEIPSPPETEETLSGNPNLRM